jgi:hypothetical protein
MSPTMSPIMSPIMSPMNYLYGSDYIVPPTPFNLNTVRTQGLYGLGTTMLIPNDIYIPSFTMVSDLVTMRGPYGVFNDVCDTASIRENVTKIIYYKFLDKWLYSDRESKYILGYLKVSDGKVQLISDVDKKDDYKNNSQEIVDKKVDYIEKHVIAIDDVYAILQRYTQSTNVSWCELTKNTFFVRESIEKSIEKKLKRMIGEK